ncbi:MAG: SH3 domain-containing protein [Chloroflexota bacterium]
MSLGERLREMLDPGTTAAGGAQSPNGSARRRARTQAQPVNPTLRSYDSSDPGRSMPRAQWIGLGLAAAAAVALTAGLVFWLLTLNRPSASTATPTPLALGPSPTTAQSVAAIFASPSSAVPPTAPAVTPPPVNQRLQVSSSGGGGVNLRRDPGQTGERLKTLSDGTLLELVGPDRTVDGAIWRNVRDPQGEVGWVAGEFLVPEGSSSVAGIPGSSAQILPPATSSTSAGPASTAAPRPTTGVAASGATRGQVGNTGGQGANIRSEPGSGGRVLKTLADGSNLEVLGPEKEVDGTIWRQVRDPSSGITGWIVRGAVAPAGSVPTPVPAPGRPTAAPATGATAAPVVKPSTGSGNNAAPTATPKPSSGSGSSGNGPSANPTTPPGNLPVIIQPATPRPSSGSGSSGGGTTPTPKATAKPN